jgi:UDP-glucuronate 4-epimerase
VILVTGAAGFIGFHLIRHLKAVNPKLDIIGIDNFNDYYSPRLKHNRSENLKKQFGVKIRQLDITDCRNVDSLFENPVDTVIHLAAQAGVRYSIENPRQYVNGNIVGFTNILEAVRARSVRHCIYASSSSVYGNDSDIPFSENQGFRSFESLYAVTKATNEMMASVYSRLYGLHLTGLRFFTVYGSWGRPDMAYYSFSDAIREGRPIKVYNHGDMERDFTHVSDIVSGIASIIEKGPLNESEPQSNVYNIGRGQPISLMGFIEILEKHLGREVEKELLPMQPGDVRRTWADVSALRRDYGYEPSMDLDDGIEEFVGWYKDYHGI